MENVYRRGNSWLTNVQVQGKRIRRSYRTKPQAQRAATDLKLLRSSQRWGDTPKDISWSFFKLKYTEYGKTNKDEQTQYRDAHSFKMLESAFPIVKLHQIKPELLESLKGKLLAKYNKPAINRCLSAIKAAMRRAEAWKYVTAQDWRTVSMLKTPKNRLLFYSLEELGELQKQCKGVWLTGFMLGYEAGLRPMEKFKLRVVDVNWHLHKLHIFDSKGGKSRWIPMTSRLESYLKSWPMEGEYVLGDDRPNKYVWSSYWRKLIRGAKLKGSEYTLRHTFASHLAMTGVPLIKIADLMGHSSIKTTMLYSHLSPESLETSIQRLPEPVAALCTPFRVA